MIKFDLTTDQPQILHLDQLDQYQINLLAPGASVTVRAGFWLKNKDQGLLSVTINHLAPHTQSQTVLKAVGDDQSFTKLVGRIIIAPDCYQVKAFLTERVLLISPQARAETVPDLEIKSHDVHCSHASSISQLDQTELFYLMSRGLPLKEAKKLILSGFLASL